MKNHFLFFAACLFLFSFGCAQAPQEEALDQEKVKAEITAIDQAWAKAETNKDLDAVMAIYAEDAQIFPPNNPPVVGKSAIRERNAADSANVVVTFDTKDVFAGGDLAMATGIFTVKDQEGNTVDQGSYMTLYQKIDGKYMVIRDTWNSNMPDDDEDEDIEGDDDDDDAGEGSSEE